MEQSFLIDYFRLRGHIFYVCVIIRRATENQSGQPFHVIRHCGSMHQASGIRLGQAVVTQHFDIEPMHLTAEGAFYGITRAFVL